MTCCSPLLGALIPSPGTGRPQRDQDKLLPWTRRQWRGPAVGCSGVGKKGGFVEAAGAAWWPADWTGPRPSLDREALRSTANARNRAQKPKCLSADRGLYWCIRRINVVLLDSIRYPLASSLFYPCSNGPFVSRVLSISWFLFPEPLGSTVLASSNGPKRRARLTRIGISFFSPLFAWTRSMK